MVYLCPMHPEIRRSSPESCSKCGMALVIQGTRFPILRHMLSNPWHLVIMALVMAAIMMMGLLK